MRDRACAALFMASLLASPTAAAQQRPAGEPSEIVVTGNRNVEEQVADFVGALTAAPPGGQLARFERAVCPVAFGLSPTQKRAVESRLRAVAAAAGIEVGPAGCAPNALVMVTQAKGPFLQALQRRRPEYFGALSVRRVRALMRAPGSTAAWQLEEQVNARGVAITPQSLGGPPINRTTTPGSLVTAGARPAFEAAALVVEQGALQGLTTIQLADYAAMRLFARTDPARLAGSSANTILNVLDAPMGSEVPLTMTEWDLEFLRGFYASGANLRAGAQRSAIERRVREGLGRSEPSAGARPQP